MTEPGRVGKVEAVDLDYAVLADGVGVRPDGKLDFFGAGFDSLRSEGVPVRHPQMALALRFLLTSHEAESPHATKVVLLHEDGAEIARVEAEIAEVPPEVRARIAPGHKMGIVQVMGFHNLLFPTFGRYHFAIHWDGNEARPPIPLSVDPLGGALASSED